MLCWLPCNYRATFPQQMKKIKQRLEYIFLHLAPVPFNSFAQQTGSPERSLLVGQPFSKTQECLHTISYNFTRTTKKIEKSVKHWTTNGITLSTSKRCSTKQIFEHTLTEILSLLHLSSLALLIRFEVVQIWHQASVTLSAPRPVDSSNPLETET